MTASEALSKIKQLFEEPATEAPAEVQAPKEYSLADGTVVAIDVLDIGGKVTIEGAPAPAGSHTLMDGQVITVDETGTITDIAAAPQPVDETMQKIAALEAQIADIRAAYDTKLAEQASQFAAQFSDYTNKIHGLKDIIEQMMTTPVADPVQPVKHFESKDEKIARFLEFTKKIK